MQDAPAQPRRFRWEIEGLRAVAALLVAIYHVWFGRVSGGVDVFFVIAGFMITNTLLGHLRRHGRIDIGRYVGRLMQRLIPNAALVLVLVSIATWLFIPVTRRDEVFGEIAASALYYENWELARRSVDYLDRDFTNSPVQHFWAMSIQGQFYLLWLALFVVVLKVGPADAVRRRITVAMVILVLVSLGFSVWFTGVNQPTAYFHTGARVWEFGIGGLLALSLPWWPVLGRRLSLSLGWIGLIAIVSCGALLTVGTSFPGWIALWPVTGAALILFAGHTDSRWSASTLLSSTPLVKLGSVSYALYLWHWPILVFVLVLTGRDQVGLLLGLAIIGISIALSFASTHFVERPVRSLKLDARSAWSLPLIAALVIAPVAAMGYVVAATSGNPPAVVSDLDPERFPAAAAAGPEATSLTSANTENPVPSIAAAPDDVPVVYEQGCHASPTDVEVVACEYGDPSADRTMVLVGGSHSAQWQPALAVVAEQQDWRLLSATKSGCRPGTQLVAAEEDETEDGGNGPAERESCREWNTANADWIVKQDPNLVVLTSTVGSGANERVPETYLAFWDQLDLEGLDVLAIRDTPRPAQNVPDCLAANGPTTQECDATRTAALAPVDPTDSLSDPPDNVVFADLSDYFCDDVTCPAVIGNVIAYSDASHISSTYSRTLAEALMTVAPVLR